MDYSLRNILITATIILIFITCILNFIVIFPIEQGVTFSGNQSTHQYLTINSSTDLGTSSSLNNLSNSSTNAFNQWDVTQGFMGSNSMKQSQTTVTSSVTQVFTSLTIISEQLFGSDKNSPILYVLGILSILAGIIIVYAIYKFGRTGQ